MPHSQKKFPIYLCQRLATTVLLVSTLLCNTTGCTNQKNQTVSDPNSLAASQDLSLNKHSKILHIAVIPAQSSQKQADKLKALAKYCEL
jgi:ABC-type phosphate/phosphonate transport system substrate-binding protein